MFAPPHVPWFKQYWQGRAFSALTCVCFQEVHVVSCTPTVCASPPGSHASLADCVHCTAFHFPISARAWGALPPRAELGWELRACLTTHPVTQRSWSGGLAKVVSDTPVSLPGGSGWCTDMRRLPTTTTTKGTGSGKLCWPQIGSDCTVSITPALRNCPEDGCSFAQEEEVLQEFGLSAAGRPFTLIRHLPRTKTKRYPASSQQGKQEPGHPLNEETPLAPLL